MQKLTINKETLLKLNHEELAKVEGGKLLTATRTQADNCTDSCIMTNKRVICCW
jgi:bacteriocin-like protein